jgi:hypothetical protein
VQGNELHRQVNPDVVQTRVNKLNPKVCNSVTGNGNAEMSTRLGNMSLHGHSLTIATGKMDDIHSKQKHGPQVDDFAKYVNWEQVFDHKTRLVSI